MRDTRRWAGTVPAWISTMAMAAAASSLVAPVTLQAATVELLKDIGDNDIAGSSDPVYLGAVGTRAYFTATRFDGSKRLYRTDGTTASTVPVVTSEAFRLPRDGMAVAGHVVFAVVRDSSDFLSDVWSTDGTDAGTLRLVNVGRGEVQLYWLGVDEARGFFCAGDFSSPTLYVTNGTVSGTAALLAGRAIQTGNSPLLLDGRLYFMSSIGITNSGLWVSDGTASGTRELLALSATPLSGVERILHVESGVALVSGWDSGSGGVFSVNLTTGATTRLASVQSMDPYRGAQVGPLHYFLDGARLWRTDGTAAGTFEIADSASFPGHLSPRPVIGGRALFDRVSSTDGHGIWSTDGSLAGTRLLHDIAPGLAGNAVILAATPTHMFYIAGDVLGSEPVRLWVTDGTGAGTHVIPVGGSTNYNLPMTGGQFGTVADGRVYLHVQQFEDVPGGSIGYYRLFSTDLAGTAAVDAGRAGLGMALGSSYLFTSNTDPAGREPWISDGTQAGTMRLADISVSGQTNSSAPEEFTLLGNLALFEADDGDHGRELWATDGTQGGTRLVKDILSGSESSAPSGFAGFGGVVYFTGKSLHGVQADTGRLWRSDGTEAGTFQLGETRASTGTGTGWATEFNGRVWFFGSSENFLGAELWSTDGSVAGTRREFLLPPEARFERLCELHTTSNGMIFIKDSVPNAELWRSDGTLQGTTRIPNLRAANVSAGSGFISAPITMSGGTAYLLADGGNGFEPWRTNGTAAGTAQVSNLAPGTEGAQVFLATAFGDGIVFTFASESGSADGLWRIAGPTADATRIKSGFVSRAPVSAGSRVFFRFVERVSGTESLWVTDGTSGGTLSVLSANSGAALSIGDLVAGEGVAFFEGSLAGSSQQLWVTDGSAGGARSIGSLPGGGSIPSQMIVLQGRPLLTRSDPALGVEPYVVRNAAPVAVADTASVAAGRSVLISVRANDTDADSMTADLTVTIVASPANGAAVVENGSVRYTPIAGFSGNDSLQYRLRDEIGTPSNVVTVELTVTAASGGGGSGGGSGGGGGGGGGSLDFVLLAMLAGALLLRGRAAGHLGADAHAAAIEEDLCELRRPRATVAVD